jgi:hypothetical protein
LKLKKKSTIELEKMLEQDLYAAKNKAEALMTPAVKERVPKLHFKKE